MFQMKNAAVVNNKELRMSYLIKDISIMRGIFIKWKIILLKLFTSSRNRLKDCQYTLTFIQDFKVKTRSSTSIQMPTKNLLYTLPSLLKITFINQYIKFFKSSHLKLQKIQQTLKMKFKMKWKSAPLIRLNSLSH